MIHHRFATILFLTFFPLAVTMQSQTSAAGGFPGIFGTVTAHPKAGDSAPDLVFSKILNSPSGDGRNPVNLSGKTTVLVFFPLVSRNPQPMAMWNTLIQHFADKPVQFVLITSENETTLLPWLQQHPVGGLVLYDTEKVTGRAYGLDQPSVVYIGPDRKIVGFDHGSLAQERTVTAVLEGKITTTPQTSATIDAFMRSGLTLLQAEPPRMPRPEDFRPKFPPSTTVHISPSSAGPGTGNHRSNDYWSLSGYTLRMLISQVYQISSPRLVLPAALDTETRYDVALVLPANEQHDQMKDLLEQAIQNNFKIAPIQEERTTDVYVLTAPDGHPPVAAPREMGGFASISGGERRMNRTMNPSEMQKALTQGMGIDSVAALSAGNTTIDDFCRMMEGSLDRAMVNETNLQGRFNIQVQAKRGAAPNGDTGFREALRTQANLVATPAQRKIDMLIFRAQ